MIVELFRTYREKETTSIAHVINDSVDVVYTFVTVELPWKDNQRRISCIPEGEYKLVKNKNPEHIKKFGNHFDILNVPDRDGIKIHCGNYYTQILGCVLPGKSLVDINGDGEPDVNYTRIVLDKLFEILPDESIIRIKKSSKELK